MDATEGKAQRRTYSDIKKLIEKFTRYKEAKGRIEAVWRQADHSSRLDLRGYEDSFLKSHPGEGYRQADTLYSNILKAVLKYLPQSISVRGRSLDHSAVAKMVEACLRWQVSRPQFLTELSKAIRDSVKYGTGIIEVDYADRAETRGSRPPRIICRSPWNVYPSPGADSVEDSYCIFVRTRVPKEWLRAQGFEGEFYPADETREQLELDLEEYAELLRIFVPYETIWVINREFPIASIPWRATRNGTPVCPLFRFPLYIADTGLESGFWGIGLYEILAPVENDMIELRNLAYNALQQATRQLLLVVNEQVDPTSIARRLETGLLIADNPNAVVPLHIPDTSQSAFITLERFRMDAQNMTAIHQFMQGSPQAGVDTASEFLGLVDMMQARMLNPLLNLQSYLLQPLLEYIADLWLNYVDPALAARLIGRLAMEAIQSQPELIDTETEEYDIHINLGLLSSTEDVRLTKALQLLPTLATIPGFDAVRFVTDEILPSMGVINAEKYYNPAQGVNQQAPLPPSPTALPENMIAGETTRQEVQGNAPTA